MVGYGMVLAVKICLQRERASNMHGLGCRRQSSDLPVNDALCCVALHRAAGKLIARCYKIMAPFHFSHFVRRHKDDFGLISD
jgi:hypothetical protein